MTPFRFLVDPTELPLLAARYAFTEDAKPLDAGIRIRNGEHTRANLSDIFEWKTRGRGRSRLTKNTDQEIADVLALVIVATTDRAAVAVLTGLEGVHIPVASAVLTAIFPERFTIIDFRALQALNIKNAYITIDFYLSYLKECRALAQLHNISLRNFDRALWQWSYEKSQTRT
jgi:hypothetical protein